MKDLAFWMRPLRQKDAAAMPGSGSRLAAENQIRNFRDRCDLGAYLFGRGDLPLGLAGLKTIDALSRSAAIQLEWLLEDQPGEVLSQIVAEAFATHNCYRLEWRLLKSQAPAWQDALEKACFREEGLLHKAQALSVQGTYQDVMTYACHRPLAATVDQAFVPFREGLFAILGQHDRITQTFFYHQGASLAEDRVREAADWLGLLGDDGKVLPKKTLVTKTKAEGYILLQGRHDVVKEAARQAAEYFAGQRQDFDLPLDLSQGQPFQTKVWQLMRRIPYGQTWSYADLARRVQPDDKDAERKLARATGRACGANPLPLLVPCHRVIGSDGRLIGFSSGVDIKNYLLEHEMLGVL